MTDSSHRFGRFEVQPSQRSLLADGRAIPLGARAFDMLVALIERRDRVVGAAELFELVWPGVVVEENNLRQQVAALRKVLGATAIVTVPGRGYRLVDPIVDAPDASAARTALTLLVPDRPSIAVLPFTVLSEDAAIGFLAEGLVEDVIALLARVPGFLMISRASTLEWRRRRKSLSTIALALGVRYVVEGSVRPTGSTLQVSTQLVEAATGHVLWTGKLESEPHMANDLQQAIARGILSELEPELTRAEMTSIRRQRPNNPDAWSHYHQAIAALGQEGWTERALDDARRHLAAALDVDPAFGLASAHFGLLTSLGLNTGLYDPSETLSQEALSAAERALDLDDGDSQVLGYAGCAIADLGQLERGAAILERALAIDPSNAQAHVAWGATMALCGELETGIEKMRYGMRISPRDRRLGFWGWALGAFLLESGQAELALEEADLSAKRDPRLFLSRVLRAAALRSLEQQDEAREALAQARRLRPTLTLEAVAASHGPQARQQIGKLWTDTAQAGP